MDAGIVLFSEAKHPQAQKAQSENGGLLMP